MARATGVREGMQEIHRTGALEDESTHTKFSVIKPKITSVSRLPRLFV